MATKRALPDDGEDGIEMGVPAQESKRLKNAIRFVTMGRLTLNHFVSKMEPFLRAMVRNVLEETFQCFLQPSLRSPFKQTQTSRRGLLLHFVNKSPSTIFTGSRIEAEDGSPIRIQLLDANTNTIVTSGALSSMKIEILVLDGDFGSDDLEDWSEHEFAAKVIHERDGRRPLVTGELNVTLRDGVGQIGHIVFTDNSSWQRSRTFRLGARAVQNNSGDLRIREGRSGAFVVKDHRGELYKKHHPPYLGDEIWRLEKIAKDGASHRRLVSHGIHTVKDFLQLHAIDPSTLRNMLGGGIKNRIWDTIIEHATSCVLDDNLFTYYDAGNRVGLVFNSVYKAVGATFDGKNYKPFDKLTPPQQVVVENAKQQAYKNVNDFILTDAGGLSGSLKTLTSLQTEAFHGPNFGLQQHEFLITHEDQPEMQLFNPNSSSVAISGQLTGEYISEVQTSSASPVNPTWKQGNACIFTSGNDGEFRTQMPRIRKSMAGWRKLRSAVKVGLVCHDIAAQKFLEDCFV